VDGQRDTHGIGRAESIARIHIRMSMLGWLSLSQYSRNDFELVIRAAKELEWLLDTHFGAYGKGLHEKVRSPLNTIRRLRRGPGRVYAAHAALSDESWERGGTRMTCAGVVSTLPTSRTSAGHPVRAWPPCSSTAHPPPSLTASLTPRVSWVQVPGQHSQQAGA